MSAYEGAGGGSRSAVPDSRELRRTLGQFATGVTVVTCLGPGGQLVGMTANSFTSVSLEPPLVLWSVDRKARSFEAFANAERFAFSVLSQGQVDIANRFARPGADKFGTLDWQPGLGGVPLLPGAAAHVECARHEAFDGGDHLVVVGRVVRFARHERPALVFAQGRYGAVAPHPGGPDAAGEAHVVAAARHPYDDFLVPLLFRAYTHVFNAFAGTLESEDMTARQMRILSILSAGGPVEEGALLTRSMLSRSRFEEARQSLHASGLIAEGAEGLALTAEGERKLVELLRLAVERERHATRALDASEVEMLRTLLRKLVLHHEGET